MSAPAPAAFGVENDVPETPPPIWKHSMAPTWLPPPAQKYDSARPVLPSWPGAIRSGLMRPQFEAAGWPASSCGEHETPFGAGPIEEKPERALSAAVLPERFAPRLIAFFEALSFETELARPLGAVLVVAEPLLPAERNSMKSRLASVLRNVSIATDPES